MFIEVYGGRLVNLDYAKSVYVWPDDSRNKVIVETYDKNYLLTECDNTETAKGVLKSIAEAMRDGQRIWKLSDDSK